ncbi:hypothetical protein LTR78_008403 [Recurvomyces mirabilis]|uniref:EDC4-like protein pdc1 beta-propeller domain-containing protein n=1 Tax=Recurvomyces mirabilis TaxID=574656 RepID=A0AAE0WIY9_9PEZI|nr:hypothetical protein LTR78_008403 [Recurvomyces mirabilis]KAK5155390.1 hypothetical protein LTS14_005651 [Recurvomyces mirabilis]
MAGSGDLQELFLRLRRSDEDSHKQQSQDTQQPSIWANPQQLPYQQPQLASPLFSPPINASSSVTPVPDRQRTDNLLNLLKFNSNTSQSNTQAGAMANLQNIGSRSSSQSNANAGSGNQQEFLLNLLKRPNAARATQSPAPEDKPVPSIERDVSVEKLANSFSEAALNTKSPQPASREPTPARQFGSRASRETTPFDAPQPSKASMFSYVNPFDQLHASSPLNRTPNPEAQIKKVEILKHDRDISSATNGDASGPASKTRKLGSSADTKGQSVSEALEGVGEKVDKQVEDALAKAKKAPAADNDDVESSWESAEDSAQEKSMKEDFNVKVYNFPMKPFVSITIQGDSAMPIRQDDFMVIAQLKKEFDQMDRSLVTASQSHIVYAQTASKKDNAGFRIIRQDTGDHKQVFRHSGERVFSVQLCTSAPGGDVESVLGTGINGSVFWTSLAKSGPELFAEDDVEAQGLIMPAVATPEENTSGSPVKTRAKCSSRSTELFALARSKTISIVAPETAKDREYCDHKSRKIDSEKYFADHGLRINTGKAGKDFAFSEDDTVIASLDKSGVVKFWDIKDLAARAKDVAQPKHAPVELKESIWSLTAVTSGSKSDDKPSVSSIMLLDKERPHSKAVALRYMLVGFKQNHILQLWDLGLGKAVQELRLPHEKDSDGFVSINYHPKTGIIALGHPTRNTIYFIHLSAPKYNIALMDQARYIDLLARRDPSLPKPESTAIMSGLREFSFAKVGQLRSIDMLRTPVENAAEKGSADETLFELYVMHSKGVVGIPIKRIDMGWDAHSKMMNPIDAVQAGVITVAELRMPTAVKEPVSVPAEAAAPAVKKEVKKAENAKPAVLKPSEPTGTPIAASSAPAINGDQHTPKPAIEKSLQIPEAPSETNPPLITPEAYTKVADEINAPKSEPVAASRSAPAQTAASSSDTEALSKHFSSLYQRLDADKRVSEASGAARQDAMLRLVSATLTENVEQSLQRIITANITDKVIPALVASVGNSIDRKLAEILPNQLNSITAREMKAALPSALQSALKDQQVARAVSESTATKVQQQVSGLLQQSLPTMATQASSKMVADLEKRTNDRLREADNQRQQANQKIEELSNLVRSLSGMIQSMADSQSTFQEQILKLQRERKEEAAAQSTSHKSDTSTTTTTVGDPEKTAEEREVHEITQLLVDSNYENATVRWLQSANQAALFDNLFVRVNPQYLQRVSPLVALSVSAALTATLDTNTKERLEWLKVVLSQMNIKDAEISDVVPHIMDVLSQRLQGAYMVLSEEQPNSPALKSMAQLNRQVGEIKRALA